MDDEDLDLLSPRDKFREQLMLTRVALLLRDERSRYETQAKDLLTHKKLKTENDLYIFSYFVKTDGFICKGQSKSPYGQSFSTTLPIPDSQEDQIEQLIDLFAESEAGLPDQF